MARGQFLGPKATYLYVSDSNETYRIRRDQDLAAIDGVDLVRATVQNSIGSQAKPDRFEPRGVFWQATSIEPGARKFIICGTRQAALYVSTISQALTIDGVPGVTTGRKGETMTFEALDDAPEPAP